MNNLTEFLWNFLIFIWPDPYYTLTNFFFVFQGLCKCDRGYGGADCGLDLSQGPHVTALDNLGLCDVRTKPCRDVIVIAEQLATQSSDELKCIIEIYKVCPSHVPFMSHSCPTHVSLMSLSCPWNVPLKFLKSLSFVPTVSLSSTL